MLCCRSCIILFTSVVPMPRPVLGPQLILDMYLGNEYRGVDVAENHSLSWASFVKWARNCIPVSGQGKEAEVYQVIHAFLYFRFKTSIVLWSEWIILTFYHILSDSSLFKTLLVLLLNKLEQAINSTGLQRLRLGSQYQNDFDYWVGIYP